MNVFSPLCELARYLSTHDVDLNVSFDHEKRHYPLHWLCCGVTYINGDTDQQVLKIKLLLDLGADPNLKNASGNAPFTLLDCSHPQILNLVDLFLDRGADINITDSFGETLLHKSIMECNHQLFEYLLDNGATVSKKDIECARSNVKRLEFKVKHNYNSLHEFTPEQAKQKYASAVAIYDLLIHHKRFEHESD